MHAPTGVLLREVGLICVSHRYPAGQSCVNSPEAGPCTLQQDQEWQASAAFAAPCEYAASRFVISPLFVCFPMVLILQKPLFCVVEGADRAPSKRHATCRGARRAVALKEDLRERLLAREDRTRRPTARVAYPGMPGPVYWQVLPSSCSPPICRGQVSGSPLSMTHTCL